MGTISTPVAGAGNEGLYLGVAGGASHVKGSAHAQPEWPHYFGSARVGMYNRHGEFGIYVDHNILRNVNDPNSNVRLRSMGLQARGVAKKYRFFFDLKLDVMSLISMIIVNNRTDFRYFYGGVGLGAGYQILIGKKGFLALEPGVSFRYLPEEFLGSETSESNILVLDSWLGVSLRF